MSEAGLTRDEREALVAHAMSRADESGLLAAVTAIVAAREQVAYERGAAEVRAVVAAERAQDGPGAPGSVEVGSGSTGGANGAEEAITRLGEQVDRLRRLAATDLTTNDEGASGAREGGTA